MGTPPPPAACCQYEPNAAGEYHLCRANAVTWELAHLALDESEEGSPHTSVAHARCARHANGARRLAADADLICRDALPEVIL